MSENEYGVEYVSITVAGIDYVENILGKEEPLSFFSQLVAERPEVAEKLGCWADYINAHSNPRKNIRKITYDLLEHILNEFVVSDTLVERAKGESNG